MHPNPTYRKTEEITALAFARDRAFGMLSVNGEAGPLLSHVPFVLDETGQGAALHLVRSNPIARLDDGPAVLAVTGPDAYVSPDWYGIDDQVPTWNYIAVHLRGHLIRQPQDTILDLLNRQSAFLEGRLAPKPVWMPQKMSPDTLTKMARAVVPYRFEVAQIDSTYKLGQNKAPEVRLAAADQIGTGFGSDISDLAQAMRDAEA